MKQKTYALVSPVQEQKALWNFLQLIRKMLLSNGVTHNIPKLGWHITLITPFEATTVEPIWFLLGMALGSCLYSHNGPTRLIRTTGFDFFDGPNGSSSLVLRLETDDEFREIVSRTRAIIQHTTNVTFPAKNFQANFHVTVAELIPSSDITRRGVFWNKLRASHTVPIVAEIDPPQIYLKDKDGWTPVVI